MAADTSPAGPVPGDGPAGLPDQALADISLALFHLRRVWGKPDLVKRIRAQTSAGPGGRPLQLSNLMVVHVVGGLSLECANREPAGEVTVGAVAERLEIDPSTASRLVGHAIDAGLVSRRPSPLDARRANLGLTEAGLRVKQVADRFRRAYLAELMSDWTREERTVFAELLTRFTNRAAHSPMDHDVNVDKIFQEARADPPTDT
ncbi:MarR family winged helix-turn-helix transcriptional regulator [Actinomadura parmotrematis]|uniref:MarR family winged helix-turn-helix transcriptional regulator n=1 Tax=Actinomadura parmotrematis TaxID=2864039 RepID=A0ABS7G697_9ACTN|nr:MarR family winged helix-turn-helix transcriptional regulator [Actinomadura parmotrematis]MBW8487332.1 MarR family winged helix-turn-helix transcriptional regulator [Actinomadura parmotrematis]